MSSSLLAQATGQNVTTGGMKTSREKTAQEKRQSPFGLRKFSEKKTVLQRRRNSHLARPDGSRFHFSDDEQSSSDGEDEGSDGEDDEDSDKDERTENDNDSDKENSEAVSGSTRIDNVENQLTRVVNCLNVLMDQVETLNQRDREKETTEDQLRKEPAAVPTKKSTQQTREQPTEPVQKESAQRDFIKLPTYDGESELEIFLNLITTCRSHNCWNELQTRGHVETALRGKAVQVLMTPNSITVTTGPVRCTQTEIRIRRAMSKVQRSTANKKKARRRKSCGSVL